MIHQPNDTTTIPSTSQYDDSRVNENVRNGRVGCDTRNERTVLVFFVFLGVGARLRAAGFTAGVFLAVVLDFVDFFAVAISKVYSISIIIVNKGLVITSDVFVSTCGNVRYKSIERKSLVCESRSA